MGLKLILASALMATVTLALRQELVLHESLTDGEQENSYHFQSQVPDASPYPTSEIVRVCGQGLFAAYSEVNYTNLLYFLAGDECRSDLTDVQTWKSFRYLGASNTSQDSISFYSETDFRGEELLIQRSPYAGINSDIGSLAWTGKSAWTLFEGINFDGNYICLEAPDEGLGVSAASKLSSYHISKVGSLFKGCITNLPPECLDVIRKSAA